MSRIPIIIEKLKKCGLLGLRSPLSFSFKNLKLSLRKVVCRGMSVVQNSNNSWQKLQSYGWNTPFLKTDETEMTFNHNLRLSHSEISHLSANNLYHTLAVSTLNCLRDSVCECANSSLEREGPLWGPEGSLRVLPPIWPGQIPLLYPGDDISKNHLSSPCSFRGDRCKSFRVFFRLVF